MRVIWVLAGGAVAARAVPQYPNLRRKAGHVPSHALAPVAGTIGTIIRRAGLALAIRIEELVASTRWRVRAVAAICGRVPHRSDWAGAGEGPGAAVRV